MSEKQREEAIKQETFLWRLTDAEIADECSRFSYVYPANGELNNRLAILFEAVGRILKNQINSSNNTNGEKKP